MRPFDSREPLLPLPSGGGAGGGGKPRLIVASAREPEAKFHALPCLQASHVPSPQPSPRRGEGALVSSHFA